MRCSGRGGAGRNDSKWTTVFAPGSPPRPASQHLPASPERRTPAGSEARGNGPETHRAPRERKAPPHYDRGSPSDNPRSRIEDFEMRDLNTTAGQHSIEFVDQGSDDLCGTQRLINSICACQFSQPRAASASAYCRNRHRQASGCRGRGTPASISCSHAETPWPVCALRRNANPHGNSGNSRVQIALLKQTRSPPRAGL